MPSRLTLLQRFADLDGRPTVLAKTAAGVLAASAAAVAFAAGRHDGGKAAPRPAPVPASRLAGELPKVFDARRPPCGPPPRCRAQRRRRAAPTLAPAIVAAPSPAAAPEAAAAPEPTPELAEPSRRSSHPAARARCAPAHSRSGSRSPGPRPDIRLERLMSVPSTPRRGALPQSPPLPTPYLVAALALMLVAAAADWGLRALTATEAPAPEPPRAIVTGPVELSVPGAWTPEAVGSPRSRPPRPRSRLRPHPRAPRARSSSLRDRRPLARRRPLRSLATDQLGGPRRTALAVCRRQPVPTRPWRATACCRSPSRRRRAGS